MGACTRAHPRAMPLPGKTHKTRGMRLLTPASGPGEMVESWRGVAGSEPQTIDAEISEIRPVVGDAVEVSEAVTICIGEAAT
jgi:hypothetical protein